MRLFLLLGLSLLAVVGRAQPSASWGELKGLFGEVEAIQGQNFKRLSFQVGKRRWENSLTFKLLITDQLGRQWAFKSGDFQLDGAIAMYRLYHLAGVPTPETQPLTLEINGTVVHGTAQRWLLNQGEGDRFAVKQFQAQGLEDLARNHLLSWLALNHQVYVSQFLVTGADQGWPAARVVRIDNSVEWFLLGQDKLSYDYVSPRLWFAMLTGYSNFWQTYFRKDIDLDLDRLLQFARFLQDIPDDLYADFFAEGVRNGFKTFSNSQNELVERYYPDIWRGARMQDFIPRLLKRKHRLAADAEKFYKEMAEIRGETFRPLRRPDGDALVRERIAALQREKAELLEERGRIDQAGTPAQKGLDFDGSYAAHVILMNAYLAATYRTIDENRSALESVRAELERLLSSARHPLERGAIARAIEDASRSLECCVSDADWKGCYHARFIRDRMMHIERRLKMDSGRVQ